MKLNINALREAGYNIIATTDSDCNVEVSEIEIISSGGSDYSDLSTAMRNNIEELNTVAVDAIVEAAVREYEKQLIWSVLFDS